MLNRIEIAYESKVSLEPAYKSKRASKRKPFTSTAEWWPLPPRAAAGAATLVLHFIGVQTLDSKCIQA